MGFINLNHRSIIVRHVSLTRDLHFGTPPAELQSGAPPAGEELAANVRDISVPPLSHLNAHLYVIVSSRTPIAILSNQDEGRRRHYFSRLQHTRSSPLDGLGAMDRSCIARYTNIEDLLTCSYAYPHQNPRIEGILGETTSSHLLSTVYRNEWTNGKAFLHHECIKGILSSSYTPNTLFE